MGDKKENDEVGYAKPPKHTRFQKGQSGNRRGRPRDKLGFLALLIRELNGMTTIKIKDQNTKKRRRDVVAMALALKVSSGDLRAIKLYQRWQIEWEENEKRHTIWLTPAEMEY